MTKQLYPFIVLAILFFSACHKDEQITYNANAKLSIATDSVLFDTVFTSVGSTVRRFKIFNFNTRAIQINELKVGGGNSSPFSVNINGRQLQGGETLIINGNDSVNVLVRVNINPTLQNQPFIVEDSLMLRYNGNKEVIPFQAYGQNANFLTDAEISTNTTWDSPLPYIVNHSVTVAENTTLTLAAGTRVLFHKDATMHIKGSLVANGTKTDTILFASDRTERIYEEEPGQWNGVYFHASSKNSVINHAMIKNAIKGLTIDSPSATSQPKLLLANSILKNMQIAGLLVYHSNISAYNNLFFNCGQYLIYAVGGGSFDLVQNTFAAYNFNFARRTPSLYFADYLDGNKFAQLQVNLTNNIIWGSLEDEISFDKKSNFTLDITLNSNLLKSKQNFSGMNNIYNIDPQFVNSRQGNMKLSATSPCLNQGIDLSNHPQFNTFLKYDMLNRLRQFPSELGCYEQE